MGLLVIASQRRCDRFPRGVGVQVDSYGQVQAIMPPDLGAALQSDDVMRHHRCLRTLCDP